MKHTGIIPAVDKNCIFAMNNTQYLSIAMSMSLVLDTKVFIRWLHSLKIK